MGKLHDPELRTQRRRNRRASRVNFWRSRKRHSTCLDVILMSAAKDEAQDFSKPTKWEMQAKEHEAKEAEAKALASHLFSPLELTKQSKQIHEAIVPVLGKLRYGELTLDDSFTIAQCKTDADKSSMAAYLMLKKAYPEMPSLHSGEYSASGLSRCRLPKAPFCSSFSKEPLLFYECNPCVAQRKR